MFFREALLCSRCASSRRPNSATTNPTLHWRRDKNRRLIGVKTPIRHSRRVQVVFETLSDLIAGSPVGAHSKTGAASILHDWKQWISFRAPFFSWLWKGWEGCASIFIPHLSIYEQDISTVRNVIEPRCGIFKRELIFVHKDFFLDIRIFWIWRKYKDFCVW